MISYSECFPLLQAIPSQSARRALFEHFVKTRAEEERKEKRAAQKAAIEGFKHLLEEATEVSKDTLPSCLTNFYIFLNLSDSN